MKEYDIISKFFSPLAGNFSGSFGLKDDIAVIPKDKKTDYVISSDSIVEGVHFLENSIPEAIAARLLASNLSDIASAGAMPKYYMLNGTISSKTDEKWLKAFTDKVSKIQQKNHMELIGGDTVKCEDRLFFSVTIIGEVPKGAALLRSGAKVGDAIYVSGYIGESYMGLQILKGEMDDLSYNDKNYYINRYVDPVSRIDLGKEILPYATSCTDVSDGLLIDLENICDSSSVSAQIDKYLIPVTYKKESAFPNLVTAGDDLELIFTVPDNKSSKISEIKEKFDIPISKIGKIVKRSKDKKDIVILDAEGKEYKIDIKGYQHET